jgi:predicted DNA-binding transcriptional regulator AlpA
MVLRKVVRKPVVLAATGYSNSTLYDAIARGKFPKPTKIDPDGRISVWFEDEIIAFQQRAIEHQAEAAKATSGSRSAVAYK